MRINTHHIAGSQPCLWARLAWAEASITAALVALVAACMVLFAPPAAAQDRASSEDAAPATGSNAATDTAPQQGNNSVDAGPAPNNDASDGRAGSAPADTGSEEADAPDSGPVLNPRLVDQPEESTQVGRASEFTVEFDLPEGFEWLSIRPIGNRFVEFLGNEDPRINGQTAQVQVSIAVYRPGEYRIDGFELTYLTPTGTQRQESTAPVTVDVESVIANEQDPTLAAAGPFRMVRTHNPVPLYLLGGALLAALGFLLFWIFRTPEEQPVEVVPQRPAHELALEALDRLEARELLEQGQHLEFHMVLSAILRDFVGRRYGFHAPEMTTTEIRAALQERQKDVGSYAEEILSVLVETDIVKFAKGTPPKEESRHLFDRTRELVEEIAARELNESNDVPEPLSGVLPEGDADAEPTYDDQAWDAEHSAATAQPSATEDDTEPPTSAHTTVSREPRTTLPLGPANGGPQRERRVAPENVIVFGDRAKASRDGAKKPASLSEESADTRQSAPQGDGEASSQRTSQTPPPPAPDSSSTSASEDETRSRDDSLDALRARLRAAREEDRDD